MYKKIIIILSFMLLLPVGVDAGRYQELPCSMYGSDGNGCDQCFDGGAKYVGDVFRPDDYFNAGGLDRIYWAKENQTRYEFSILNNNTNWYVSNDLLGYPPTFLWYTANNGDHYHIFRKDTSTRFLATKQGKGIMLNSVANDSVSPTEPAMKFTFIANFRDLLGTGQQGPLQTHKECVFYQARYCGDGILQTDKGEVCDPNDPNQVGFGSGGCDPVTCQPINNPTCNGLTVNPNSGDTPLNVVARCEGFKVNTWQIDCGNGQVFTGNGDNGGVQTFQRTCNYTTAGNFTPRCTINGSITNNSCRKTVNVASPLNPSIIIDKTDANVHDLDGIVGNDTQTVYKGERAVFKIRVTNNGNETLRDIRLTDPNAPACATRGTTTVDLKNNRFTNINNQTVTITQGGAGNKNDNRLDPGEWFEYTCEQGNSQANYTNTAGTTGVGITTGTTVSDTDPTQIIVIERPNPRIEVDKRDANPNDLDGNIGGNDSQTVRLGDKAVFSITVTNNGEEDLKNIVLIDERAPACATADGTFVDLQNKRFTNRLGQRVNIQFTGLGNHTNNILEVGEKFFYTCEEPNTQANYTNVVEVRGTGINSNQTVTDDDSTAIVVERSPSIQVDKTDANPNDLDGVQFNNTQTVLKGTEAIFQIRVINNGNENLKDIKLVDPIAPACATADGTFVDLQNKRFTNQLGQTIVILPAGKGNPNNNVLEVGEEFIYTCARDNTVENYTNSVDVEGTGIISGKKVTDRDTTPVIVAEREPNISIDKRDANPDDLDGIVGNDTQTVNKGDRAVFKIEVRNIGSEPLKNVQLTDEKAPACATADGTFVDFVNNRFINQLGNQVQINLVNISKGVGANNEFKTGAIFFYTCEQGNTQADYVNTARVDALGVDTNTSVNDSDDTIILIKQDDVSACVDLVAEPTQGSSPLTTTLTCTGTQNAETFRIEVRNSAGALMNTLNQASGQVTLNTVGNYTASCFVNDEDTAIPACRESLEVTESTSSDVILIKSKAPGQPEIVAPGDRVHYILTIRNRGTQAANNYKVEDHYPLGLVLDDTNWTNVPGLTRVARYNQLLNIPAGGEIKINIYFRVALNFQDGPLRNLAVVCPDDIPDCSLECPPDADTRPCDDVNEEEDECGCEIITVSACTGLTADPSSAKNSLTSTLTCTGTQNAETFRIEVRNSAGALMNTLNQASGQVTLNTVGNYTASCFVNDEDTAIPACRANLNVTSGTTGQDFACNDIIKTGNTFRCIGTGRQMREFAILYNLPDETERFYLIQDAQELQNFPGRRFADFTLPSGATNIECHAANVGNKNAVGLPPTWRTSAQCKYQPPVGPAPFCGDGIVQAPEECDLGDLNGKPGSPCDANCRIRRTKPPTCEDIPPAIRPRICGVETTPGEKIYQFGPNGTIIIGHNTNPLFELRSIPMLANNSKEDIAFDKICVSSHPDKWKGEKANIINDGSLTKQEICVDIEGRKIYPYEQLFIVKDSGGNYRVVNQYANILREDKDIYPQFVGDITKIPDNVRDYGFAQIRTSVYSTELTQNTGWQQFSFYHTFLAGNVDVRVARPAVSTVGGGTSFVGSQTTSDVANITQGMSGLFKGTNFVGTSISESGVSSESGRVTDTTTISSISENDSSRQVNESLISGATTTSFTNYNNIRNVFIKKGSEVFNGTPQFMNPAESGARTYIIDGDGNTTVTISGDIMSPDNIAIIVRNGNINITSNVERIDATLMILGNGRIMGAESDKQLRINGALYGNIDKLIENRYFIDASSGSSLSVGTIVSFGSNLLRSPAPLLSQFVSEYLQSQRVAR